MNAERRPRSWAYQFHPEVDATAVACALVAVALAGARPAEAVPSFARQTGQPCGVCHTDQPGLTPFGRRFKLGGYTLGGGDYRTTHEK